MDLEPAEPARNDAWLNLSRAFRGMFWPMFLIGLNFYFRLNEIKFNLLPTALGWFWMASALRPVMRFSPMLYLMRTMAVCLVVLSLPFVIEYVPKPIQGGIRFNLPELPAMDYWSWGLRQVGSVASLMTALYVWCLGGLIVKLARQKQNQQLASSARISTVLYVVPVVLLPWLTALVHASWTAFAGAMIVYLLVIVVALALFVRLILQAAAFCHQQAFAAEGSPLDLSGKESSIVENALLTGDPQKPFRFSLWTLILMMTVIGMASSQIHLIRASQKADEKLVTAQEEAAFYRTQLERLYIYDREKVTVRKIQNRDRRLWEWRIYIPKDGMFEVRAKFNDFPREGIPAGAPDLAVRIPGGESNVSLSVDEDRGEYGSAKLDVLWENPRGWSQIVTNRNGRSVSKKNTQLYNGEHMLTAEQFEFYEGGTLGWTADGNGDGRTPMEVDQPIILCRFKNESKSTAARSGNSSTGKGNVGFVLWIEKISD